MFVKKQRGFGQLEMIVGVVVIALVVFVCGFIWHTFKENQKLHTKVETQKVTIDSQKDSIDRNGKSDAVTEQTNTNVQAKASEIEKKQAKTIGKLQAQVEEIRRQADALEAAAATRAEKDAIKTGEINAISAARIDAIWETYCSNFPAAASCTKPAS